MSSSALLTLIALVSSIDGTRAMVEGGLVRHLRPGDVGVLQVEASAGAERMTIDAGTAEVMRVGDRAAEVRLTSDRKILPGFEVRFAVPYERILEQARQEVEREAERAAQREAEPPAAAEARKVTVRAPLIPTAVLLEARVRAWAAAWSRGDPDAYLSFYTSVYQPPGMSRRQWEAQRRERLLAPAFIEVNIDAFDVIEANIDHAEVRFEQRFRSNAYEDRVTKTLVLVPERGEWKISFEEAR